MYVRMIILLTALLLSGCSGLPEYEAFVEVRQTNILDRQARVAMNGSKIPCPSHAPHYVPYSFDVRNESYAGFDTAGIDTSVNAVGGNDRFRNQRRFQQRNRSWNSNGIYMPSQRTARDFRVVNTGTCLTHDQKADHLILEAEIKAAEEKARTGAGR